MAGTHRRYESDEVKNIVAGLKTEINQEITIINIARQHLDEVAAKILALRTEDARVLHTAGLLSNRVVPDLKTTIGHLASIVETLEEYPERL